MHRPNHAAVTVRDDFWTPYLEGIRTVTLPYVFEQFEKTGYLQNFREVAAKSGAEHNGPSFSDGLVLESVRGAHDFLAACPDPVLEAQMDAVVADVCAAADADPDGYLCTYVTQQCPEQRWGENGGDIVVQHDLYDHGALVEAAVSRYLATGKTDLLCRAVRAVNYICREIGPAPKKNIVPGHSLPEEALVRLYCLFRDTRALDALAAAWNVCLDDYMQLVQFWYDARGQRGPSRHFQPPYNQDHLPFAQQREAMGHSVRAMLCYTGAAAVVRETGRTDYMDALDALWDNVNTRKIHISGGVGARHDIEGFDVDYHLPNDAYLETCAGVALAFWNGEMNLLRADAKYFDVFERALYNNVLAAVGEDFRHYFYENPLQSDGSIRRWAWHGCPCCPPMLLKLYSALGSYIYAVDEQSRTLQLNLHIGSTLQLPIIEAKLEDRTFTVDPKGEAWTLLLRIPAYAEQFRLLRDGSPVPCTVENGYAVLAVDRVTTLTLCYETPPHRICANPAVEADLGRVAVMRGPFLYCAEGIDNDGQVDLLLPTDPALRSEGDTVVGTLASGKPFCLIPYYRWCRRDNGCETDAAMNVWFRQENMLPAETLSAAMGSALYAVYDAMG